MNYTEQETIEEKVRESLSNLLHRLGTDYNIHHKNIDFKSEELAMMFHKMIILSGIATKWEDEDWDKYVTFGPILNMIGFVFKHLGEDKLNLRGPRKHLLDKSGITGTVYNLEYFKYYGQCYGAYTSIIEWLKIYRKKYLDPNSLLYYILHDSDLEVKDLYIEGKALKHMFDMFGSIYGPIFESNQAPVLIETLMNEKQINQVIIDYHQKNEIKYTGTSSFAAGIYGYENNQISYSVTSTLQKGEKNNILMISIIDC